MVQDISARLVQPQDTPALVFKTEFEEAVKEFFPLSLASDPSFSSEIALEIEQLCAKVGGDTEIQPNGWRLALDEGG